MTSKSKKSSRSSGLRGGQLRTVRDSLKWSQTRFAAVLGIDPNTYARYERGKLTIPKPIDHFVHLIFDVTSRAPAYAKDIEELFVRLRQREAEHAARQQAIAIIEKARENLKIKEAIEAEALRQKSRVNR